MTDSYYRDLFALYELIKAASGQTPSPKSKKGLDDLKKLVKQAKKDAVKVDKEAEAVRAAHEKLDKLSGWSSADMETKLNGLRLAQVTNERPALEYVLLMLGVGDLNPIPFVRGVQKALGKDRSKERTIAAAALASSAAQAGQAADTFCAGLLETTSAKDSTLLIYSALHALYSIIESELSDGTRRIIDDLIGALPLAGGGPGSCYWPSCYVYSCSCSSKSSSTKP